jgi:tRNA-2-methylthio-N6-dimethylallyladenosine synthase
MSNSEQSGAPEARPRRVYIETYGCQMNVTDTELMFGALQPAGYVPTTRLDEADIILMNTCAVREKAEERVYGRASQLLRFKYTNPNLVIGVTGCMAEHLKEKILDQAPYIDLVVGPDAYRRLPDLLAQVGTGDPVVDVKLDKHETYDGITPARGEGVTGWITIQRGCDKFCTFCIVPYTRGRERGTAPREVLRQARDLSDMGYREVTLLGQTVNSYRYEGIDFADLLRSVAEVEGLERIRFTSPYPIDFTDKLIATIAELPKVPEYVHLPLQSGSDPILSAMRRGYTLDEYRTLVRKLRAAMPDIGISTDIIVGFPDETDDDHRRTVEALEEFDFDSAFMFAYSEREGTYASKRIPDSVPDEVKKRRLTEVIALQERIGAARYAAQRGRVVEVLAEGPSRRDDGRCFGRARDFKATLFESPEPPQAGSLVRVLVEHSTSHSLFGRRVDAGSATRP